MRNVIYICHDHVVSLCNVNKTCATQMHTVALIVLIFLCFLFM